MNTVHTLVSEFDDEPTHTHKHTELPHVNHPSIIFTYWWRVSTGSKAGYPEGSWSVYRLEEL